MDYESACMSSSPGRTFTKIDTEYIIGVHTELPHDFKEEDHIIHSEVCQGFLITTPPQRVPYSADVACPLIPFVI